MPSPAIAAFLRAARAALEPSQVGLPQHGTRRVAGLRREEVAALAGVSVDYYTRLEQGRERSPSAQVVQALARALQLDLDGREHLYRLAELVPRTVHAAVREHVNPDLLRLMDSFPAAAAYVSNRILDVLASNALARELFSPFASTDNMARMVVLDPMARTVFVDWTTAAQSVVQALRLAVGYDPREPTVIALLDDLLGGSAEFAEMWAENRVHGLSAQTKEYVHPEVGRLTFGYQAFDVRSAPGQQLIVCSPEPGSRSAESFGLLSSLGATQPVTAQS